MQARTVSSQPISEQAPKIPVHVAIIMDGNGRWARKRGLPRLAGHRVGVDCIQSVLKNLAAKGVKYVTLYAFSTENWNRPAEEVEGILEILGDALRDQTQALHENDVHIVHIGRSRPPKPGTTGGRGLRPGLDPRKYRRHPQRCFQLWWPGRDPRGGETSNPRRRVS